MRHRVLYVITDTDIGGAERFLARLVRHLPPAWQPHIVSLGPLGALGQALQAEGYAVTALAATPARAPLALARLVRIADRFDPHIVHSILCHGNLAARVLKLLRPLPVVASVRVAERGNRWQRVAEQLTWRLADHVTAVSDRVAQFLVRHGVARARLTVIPNAVEPPQPPVDRAACRRALGTGERDEVLLFAGRLTHQKGLDVLLRSLPLLLDERPDIVLWVAGRGNRASYERLAGALGVADAVRWLGFRNDLASLMQAADLLVLPSRWEGQPNVVLEALACGLPVVVTAVEGARELVERFGGGVLVPPESPHELASAIARALDDCALRDRAAEGGRRYMASWDVQAEVTAYVQLYERLCHAVP